MLVVGGYESAALDASQDSADLPLGYVAAALFDDCPYQLAKVQRPSVHSGHAVGKANQNGRVAAVLKEFVKLPKCSRNNYCRLFGCVGVIGVARASSSSSAVGCTS